MSNVPMVDLEDLLLDDDHPLVIECLEQALLSKSKSAKNGVKKGKSGAKQNWMQYNSDQFSAAGFILASLYLL